MIDKLRAAILNCQLTKALEFLCIPYAHTRIGGTTGDLFQLELECIRFFRKSRASVHLRKNPLNLTAILHVYGDCISGSDVVANGYIEMWRVAEWSSVKNSVRIR